ncbi:Speedy protein E4A [Galemys pyrenaicus]|uniref:Speedy protein E4A n=1 Tax=Galemys pyrenaicus TaxID=202257 RepID=A0A8J5ZU94_GALPY|nr:Speedy protein E4A [Galemys pyrenaicus]
MYFPGGSLPPSLGILPLLAATQNRSLPGSCSASSEADPEQRTKRRGQKRTLMDVKAAVQDNPPASSSTSSEVICELKSWRKRGQKRNIWTVNHVEGTKLRMNKRRRPSYRPEDQEAFYRLLDDPVIQSFLEADIFLKVSDKYLLSMVVEYFGRVGLPGHLYNRIHFFLALYIASDMEEDNPTSKRSIFQFLLGREHWPDLYKEFLKLKVEFFQAMGHRAWVTPELCEEVCGGRGDSQGAHPGGEWGWAFPPGVHAPVSLADPGPEPTPLGLESGAPVCPLGPQGLDGATGGPGSCSAEATSPQWSSDLQGQGSLNMLPKPRWPPTNGYQLKMTLIPG